MRSSILTKGVHASKDDTRRSHRMREREAETQAEGEAGSMHREPDNKTMCKSDEKDSRSKGYLCHLFPCQHGLLQEVNSFPKHMRIPILLEKRDCSADVASEGRAGDLLDYLLPSGYRLRGVQPGLRGRRTRDTGPPEQPPTALPTLSFLKGDSPTGKTKDPSRKTRGHRAARRGMINLSEHKISEPAPSRMTTVSLSLEQVIQTHHMGWLLSFEARTARRYWNNYVDQE
ncbi:unnamed protein product [Nyctereutes procyonoides]|uniref:(raccoon dog) hypothetical protein n=1 Tax=Nyctereutes procyonoides TaxID=34880 RepID=A0A811ZT13_NYCPR|nr:unnamed protein product [Nyctereutes procyonoides]